MNINDIHLLNHIAKESYRMKSITFEEEYKTELIHISAKHNKKKGFPLHPFLTLRRDAAQLKK